MMGAQPLVLLTLVPAATISAQTLTRFRTSALRTEYGVASNVEFSTGLVELAFKASGIH